MRAPERSGRTPASRHPAGVSAASGFTLLEGVLVVLVLAILAGLAVPSLQGFASAREAAAATRVRNVLVHAQRLAMGAGLRTWVLCDASKSTISVFAEDPKVPGRANRIAVPDPSTRAPMVVDLGALGSSIVKLDLGALGEVEFDALGVPHDGLGKAYAADGTIALRGGATVRVTRNTGRIAIE